MVWNFKRSSDEAANILGATILVLHGQNNCGRYGGIEEADYLEKYLALYELGQQFGITVAQENVNGFRSANPAFIRRMREQLQNRCAFVFDVKTKQYELDLILTICAMLWEKI